MLKNLHSSISRQRFSFALLMLLLIYGCTHTSETKSKTPLAVSEIESISLSTIQNPPFVYQLDEKQIADFEETWNKATSLGLLKAIPHFKLTVKSKNGKERHFRLGDNWVKEEGDQAFSLDHSEFWKRLMNTYGASFSKSENYSPISFIDYWVQQYKEEKHSLNMISVSPELPDNCITLQDLDTLISMLDSKEKMGFLNNPLSSFIPRDNYSEKGGVAALFIQSYIDSKTELFSTPPYYPRVNKNLNQELRAWWKSTKDIDK